MFKKLKEFFGFVRKPNKTVVTHFACDKECRDRTEEHNLGKDDSDDFALSMAVGMATDNALLGGVVGGDFLGALVGQELANLSSSSGTDSAGGFEGGGGDSGDGGASGAW